MDLALRKDILLWIGLGIGIFFGTRYVLDEFERAELQLEDQRRHEARRAAFQRQIDYSLPEDHISLESFETLLKHHDMNIKTCAEEIIQSRRWRWWMVNYNHPPPNNTSNVELMHTESESSMKLVTRGLNERGVENAGREEDNFVTVEDTERGITTRIPRGRDGRRRNREAVVFGDFDEELMGGALD